MEEDGSIHDDYRIDYLRKHIAEMKKLWKLTVSNCGVYAMGLHRSHFSRNRRNEKRYGFIHVDLDDEGKGTLKRRKKIRSIGIESDRIKWRRIVLVIIYE